MNRVVHPDLPRCTDCGNTRGPWAPTGEHDDRGAQLLRCAPGTGCSAPTAPKPEHDADAELQHRYPPDCRVKFCRVSPTGPHVGSATVLRHVPDLDMIEVETERDGEILLLHLDEIVKRLGSHEFAGDPLCIDIAIGRHTSAAMAAAGKSPGWLADELGIDRDHFANLLQGRTRWSLSIAAVTAIVLDLDPAEFIGGAYREVR